MIQSAASLGAEPQPPSEAQVKAAFLLNFPKYVDWPDAAFASTNAPLKICILGDAEVAAEFRKMSQGRIINGHPIEFAEAHTPADCDVSCQIVFVGNLPGTQVKQLFTRLSGASVLTVGDSDQFIDQGGIINLTRRNRNIGLQINLAAANEAKLKISSKLMSVAENVTRSK